jgi:cell division protein FtsL
MNDIEKLMMYLIIGIVLWVVATILLVYSKNYFFDRLIKLTKEQKRIESERRKSKDKTTNVNPYYSQCKNLFNKQMKSGVMKRDKILELKDLIDLCLGDKVLKYNSYTFKNDAHEIYVKLQSDVLNQLDYERIIKFLLKNQKQYLKN